MNERSEFVQRCDRQGAGRRRRIATTLAAVLALSVLAGCSKDSGLTGNQRVAISDFRAGANSICKARFDTLRALRQEAAARAGTMTTAAEAKDFFVRKVIPIYDGLVGDLHNLGEPTFDRTPWDDIMRQVDRQLVDAKAAIEADPLRSLSNFEKAPVKDSLDQAFIAFGTPECGNSA